MDDFFLDLLTYTCPYTGRKRCAINAGLETPVVAKKRAVPGDADAWLVQHYFVVSKPLLNYGWTFYTQTTDQIQPTVAPVPSTRSLFRPLAYSWWCRLKTLVVMTPLDLAMRILLQHKLLNANIYTWIGMNCSATTSITEPWSSKWRCHRRGRFWPTAKEWFVPFGSQWGWAYAYLNLG